MGIPAYFSYIIKNHQRIIHEKIPVKIDSLYMDCNSIIYDAVRMIEQQKDNSGENNDNIIVQVIKSIEYYIQLIKPIKIVYIAFDGVAPFAKMQQQKTRRYKTEYITRTTTPDSNINKFSTLEITPGTIFMNKLSKCIKHHFHELNSDKGTRRIIISTSEDQGEGEHKIVEHMRQYPNQEESIAIYGLDSDLILGLLYIYKHF